MGGDAERLRAEPAAARAAAGSAPGGRPGNRAAAAAAADAAGESVPPAVDTLPPLPSAFTARAAELAEILDRLDPGRPAHAPRASTAAASATGAASASATGAEGEADDGAVVVSAVAGMGGVGKTALALYAAGLARDRGWFPGGVVFADLRGYSNQPAVGTGAVADRLLRAVGVPGAEVPDDPEEKCDRWRRHLGELARAGRPLLMVLDNVHEPGQIGRLLPAGPHRALVTSRHSLSSLPAHRVLLGPLDLPDAVDLLDRALRAGGVADDRVGDHRQDAERVARLCGCLPLALRIVAAGLREPPRRPLSEAAAELEQARLEALAYDGDDEEGRPLEVRASIGLSYRRLGDERLRRALRLLAAAPGADVSTLAAEALLGAPPGAGRRLLAGLARAHLLQPAAPAPSPVLSAHEGERWSMHDLVRLFAEEEGRAHAAADRREEALERLRTRFTVDAATADAHLDPARRDPPPDRFRDRAHALAWLEGERAALVATALSAPGRDLSILLYVLRRFFGLRRHLADWVALAQAAVERGEPRGASHQANAFNDLGMALGASRRFSAAADAYRASLRLFRQAGDARQEGLVLSNLAGAHRDLREYDAALAAHDEALALIRRAGGPADLGMALVSRSLTLIETRRFPQAVEDAGSGAEVLEQAGDAHGRAQALNNLGLALMESGRYAEAAAAHRAAGAVHRAVGDGHREAKALLNLGVALTALGRTAEAVDALRRAGEGFRESADRHHEATALSQLGVALQEAGDVTAAHAAHAGALAVFEETGDRYARARALNNAGLTLLALGRWQEAADTHRQDLAVAREFGDRHGQAQALANLGRCLGAGGLFGQAVRAQADAARLFRETGDTRRETLALLAVLRLERLRGSGPARP
jgi:tetratricopeptide (TPR) repeat protein